jgi:DNA-binding LacI/PurR family transcriptional regulator
MRTAEAALLILDHLAKTAARHIVLVVGKIERPTQSEIEATYLGFCSACGMEPQIVRVDDERGEDAAYSATIELVKRSRVDAIFAPFDAYAVAAVKALNALKARIPEDIRVATRNDGNRARDSDPPITAIDLHLDVVAQQAIDLLLSQLQTGLSERQLPAPPPTIVVRQSTQKGRSKGLAVKKSLKVSP